MLPALIRLTGEATDQLSAHVWSRVNLRPRRRRTCREPARRGRIRRSSRSSLVLRDLQRSGRDLCLQCQRRSRRSVGRAETLLRGANGERGRTCILLGPRDVTGCNGATKTYSYDVPDLPATLAADPRVKKFNNYVAREQKKFRQDDEPSQSLVGMSRRGIRNLRASLGGEERAEALASPPNRRCNRSACRSCPASPCLPCP